MRMQPPLLRLHAGHLVLELAPQVGGSMAAFYTEPGLQGERVDWLRPASAAALAAHDPLGMASFPLVPWCNRIRRGQAQAHGRQIRLAPNVAGSVHPLHGLGWQQPWQVVSSGPASAVLAYEHGQRGSRSSAVLDGWPWAFSALQTFRLDEAGLACQLTICNRSDAAMPFGLGHHPYFLHPPGTRLQCDVGSMWDSDADLLPTRLVQPAFLAELRAGMTLATLSLDNNFTRWQHSFRIDWPATAQAPARCLTLSAASPLDYFVLYCPRDAASFCAEPVSNCTDWLNWQGRADPADLGGGTLLPGESCSTTFRMDVGLAA